MFEMPRRRRARIKRAALSCHSIKSLALCSRAFESPKHITQVLLDERYFCLHGKLDIGERGLFTAIFSYTGQNPSTAFLVHQASCPIDRISDNLPACIGFPCSARENYLSIGESLRNQDDGGLRRDCSFKKIDDNFFPHPVHPASRIPPPASPTPTH